MQSGIPLQHVLIDTVADKLPFRVGTRVGVVHDNGSEGSKRTGRIECREGGIGLSHPVGPGGVGDLISGKPWLGWGGVLLVVVVTVGEMDESEEEKAEDRDGGEHVGNREVRMADATLEKIRLTERQCWDSRIDPSLVPPRPYLQVVVRNTKQYMSSLAQTPCHPYLYTDKRFVP